MIPNSAPAHRRAGVGLVEVLVAVTILAIVLTSLGTLTFTTAKRAREVTSDAYRQAVLLQHTNRFMSLPYDSIAGRVGCTTVSSGNLPHTVCITSTVVGNKSTLKVKVTPARSGVAADSVTFERVKLNRTNPLST